MKSKQIMALGLAFMFALTLPAKQWPAAETAAATGVGMVNACKRRPKPLPKVL